MRRIVNWRPKPSREGVSNPGSHRRMIRVAFDIGGTFTDFVLSDDATGATHALKVPTSPANPGEAVIEGLEKLLAEMDGLVGTFRAWGAPVASSDSTKSVNVPQLRK